MSEGYRSIDSVAASVKGRTRREREGDGRTDGRTDRQTMEKPEEQPARGGGRSVDGARSTTAAAAELQITT